MKILYLGDNNPNSTSLHRANALCRIGHNVIHLNPYNEFEIQLQNPILGRIHYYTGYKYLQFSFLNWLKKVFYNTERFDIIWINSGELFGSNTLKYLKQFTNHLVLYNNDDPTGGRDGGRFKSLLKAIPFYDLCVVMRNQNKDEFYAIGAKKVMRLYMSYDEIAHRPFDKYLDIPMNYKSEVAFIGTWIRGENRDEFILKLINSGIIVSIWGERWQKSKNWNKIKPYYKGKSLGGREYVAAIQGAKICIGMLSKGNRDLHTTRSLEIPFANGVLCAERTSEHLNFYKEGEEAVFWNDSNECIKICKTLLNNHILREQIRIAGNIRVKMNKVGNEDICKKIIEEFISINN